MSYRRLVVALLAAFAVVTPAWAWGPLGHSIVAALAQRHLSPAAEAEVEHLLALGVSKELLPERLIILDELPRSSGGKIAKGRLREDIGARMEAGHERS